MDRVAISAAVLSTAVWLLGGVLSIVMPIVWAIDVHDSGNTFTDALVIGLASFFLMSMATLVTTKVLDGIVFLIIGKSK